LLHDYNTYNSVTRAEALIMRRFLFEREKRRAYDGILRLKAAR